jgi:hypothetical protein
METNWNQSILSYLIQVKSIVSPNLAILSFFNCISSYNTGNNNSILNKRQTCLEFLSYFYRSSGRINFNRYCPSLFIYKWSSFHNVTRTCVETAPKLDTCSLRWLNEFIWKFSLIISVEFYFLYASINSIWTLRISSSSALISWRNWAVFSSSCFLYSEEESIFE